MACRESRARSGSPESRSAIARSRRACCVAVSGGAGREAIGPDVIVSNMRGNTDSGSDVPGMRRATGTCAEAIVTSIGSTSSASTERWRFTDGSG